jgi:hypothetical protein
MLTVADTDIPQGPISRGFNDFVATPSAHLLHPDFTSLESVISSSIQPTGMFTSTG